MFSDTSIYRPALIYVTFLGILQKKLSSFKNIYIYSLFSSKGDFLISGGSAPMKDKVAKAAYCVPLSASYMSFSVGGFLIKKKLPNIEVPPDI